MNEVQVALTPAEWKLVSALRDLPPSALKDRIDLLLTEVIAFARDPRCGEIQADGAPCESTRGDCDSCKKVTEVIDTVRRRLTAG